MTVSRLGKLVCEVGGVSSLAEADRLRGQPVAIEIGTGERDRIACLAHTAVALALRTQRGLVRVALAEPRAPGLSSNGAQLLVDELRQQAAAYGQPARFESAIAKPFGTGVRLTIGENDDRGYTLADAAGWVAAVNRELPRAMGAEAASCAFAVSCALAKQFHAHVLGSDKTLGEMWSFSLRSFQVDAPSPDSYVRPSLDLGRVGLLGAGAIGSAFAFILGLAGWRAFLDILDRGDYEEPNEETTCLITRRDVFRRLPKAETLATAARTRRLEVRGRKVDVSSGSAELREQRDLFVCGVDNSETRRALDGVVAPFIINAAVGGSRLDAGHVLISRHGPGDAALSSLYPARRDSGGSASSEPVPAEVQDECSRVAYAGVSLAAPFIATAAAALALAECGGRVLGDDKGPNYLKLDVFGKQQAVQSERKLR